MGLSGLATKTPQPDKMDVTKNTAERPMDNGRKVPWENQCPG